MLPRIFWIRRFVRRHMKPISEPVAEKWYKRLTFLYVFLAWNTLGLTIYMVKTGKFDYSLISQLKTEQEENRSKAVEAMEFLSIPKARVITIHNFTVVKNEEVVNEALEEEKRLSDEN